MCDAPVRLTRAGVRDRNVRNVSRQQYRLTAGDYRATVTETGGGLCRLTYRGEPLILSYAPGEVAPAAFGQLLSPWPNRIDHGRCTFDGHAYQSDVFEPGLDRATHAPVRWATWHVLDQAPERLTLAYLHHGSTEYPRGLGIAMRYVLDAVTGLSVRGRRPEYRRAPGTVRPRHAPVPDRRRAGRRLPAASSRPPLPAGRPTVVPNGTTVDVSGPAYDFTDGRRSAAWPSTWPSPHWAGMARDVPGSGWTRRGPGSRSTPRPVGDHRHGVGVESMTGRPNTPATGIDLMRLEPGEAYSGSWGFMAGPTFFAA